MMPSHSERQREFMGADLARARAGEKTRTGMSESQLEDFASKPVQNAGNGEQEQPPPGHDQFVMHMEHFLKTHPDGQALVRHFTIKDGHVTQDSTEQVAPNQYGLRDMAKKAAIGAGIIGAGIGGGSPAGQRAMKQVAHTVPVVKSIAKRNADQAGGFTSGIGNVERALSHQAAAPPTTFQEVLEIVLGM